MAGNVLGVLFQDIADAIRSKVGGGTMSPHDFPDKILSIVAGGSVSGEDDTSVRATSGWLFTDETGIYRQTINHGLGTMPDMIIVSNGNWLGLSDAQRDANPLMFMWGAHSKFKDAFAGTLAGAGCAKQGITLDTGNDKGIDEYQPDSFTISCPNDFTFEFGVAENDYNGNYGLVDSTLDGTVGTYKWIAITGMGGTVSGGGSSSGSAAGCVTVTFMNGDEVLFTRPVYIGDDCPDPVEQGRIETPTKESTNYYVYSFEGWSTTDDGTVDSTALQNITEDTTLYAVIAENTRYYTIKFYDDEGAVYTTQRLAYGATPSYTPAERVGYAFEGWSPSVTEVTCDANYYAIWTETEVAVVEITDSWDEIIASVNDGSYNTKYKLGNYKQVEGFKDAWGGNFCMQIVAKNADELADGSGKAAITWVARVALNRLEKMNSQSRQSTQDENGNTVYIAGTGYVGGWEASEARRTAMPSIKASLPANIQAAIKTVTKTSMCYDTNNTLVCTTTNDDVWIPSVREVGSDYAYEFGSSTSSRPKENAGPVYSAIFYDDASRKNKSTSSSYCGLRTGSSLNNAFILRHNDGVINYNSNATYGRYVLLGFCF